MGIVRILQGLSIGSLTAAALFLVGCSPQSDRDTDGVRGPLAPAPGEPDGVVVPSGVRGVVTDDDGLAIIDGLPLGAEIPLQVSDFSSGRPVSGMEVRFAVVNEVVYFWTKSPDFYTESAVIPLSELTDRKTRAVPVLLLVAVSAVAIGELVLRPIIRATVIPAIPAVEELITDPPTTAEHLDANGNTIRCLSTDTADFKALQAIFGATGVTLAARRIGDESDLYGFVFSQGAADEIDRMMVNALEATSEAVNRVCWTEIGDEAVPSVAVFGPHQDADVSIGRPRPASTGDPHLFTLDGLAYDFQGAGEFVLVRSVDGGLEIQARQEPYGGPGSHVSVNTGFAFDIGGVPVSIVRSPTGGIAVFVQGKEQFFGGELPLEHGGAVRAVGGVFDVVWPDGSTATVVPQLTFLDLHLALHPDRQGRVIGMLGDFDGNSRNDIVTSAGEPLGSPLLATDLYGVFADGWRVDAASSLFSYIDGQSTETFTDRRFPRRAFELSDLTTMQLEHARDVCARRNVAVLLDQCLLDVGATRDELFADSAADAEGRLVGTPSVVGIEGELPSGAAEEGQLVIFAEDFDDEVAGEGDGAILDVGGVSDMVVLEGSIDLVTHGAFGLSCTGGAGGCVELDGSPPSGVSNPASVLSSRENLVLEPGEYTLTFELSGDTRNRDMSDVVDVSLGDAFGEDVGRFDVIDEPLRTRRIGFVMTETNVAPLLFTLRGPSNREGPILDSVRIVREATVR